MCGTHGVHSNICLGDDFNPSRCTAPAGAGRVAVSAWEPVRHSMCTSGTGVQWSLSSQLLVLVRSGWTNDGDWIRQRVNETHFKYCDHLYVSACCVRPSASATRKVNVSLTRLSTAGILRSASFATEENSDEARTVNVVVHRVPHASNNFSRTNEHEATQEKSLCKFLTWRRPVQRDTFVAA